MYSEKNGIKFNVYGTNYFLKYATETPIGKGLYSFSNEKASIDNI